MVPAAVVEAPADRRDAGAAVAERHGPVLLVRVRVDCQPWAAGGGVGVATGGPQLRAEDWGVALPRRSQCLDPDLEAEVSRGPEAELGARRDDLRMGTGGLQGTEEGCRGQEQAADCSRGHSKG